MVPAGAVVTPIMLALAASVGHDTMIVRPRPRVAVIVTGDEIIGAGLPPRGKIRDAIGPMLPGLLTRMGAQLTSVEHIPDTSALLTNALTVDADVIVTTGASSVGVGDHLHRALAAEVLVNGVSCRPGHPQSLARLGHRFVVGLPGNPLAALVAAVTLLHPLVCGFTGRSLDRLEKASIGEITSHEISTRLVPVQVSGSRATPVGNDMPGVLWGAALANALAVIPPNWDRRGEVQILQIP